MENITLDEWNDEMTLNLIPDTLMLAVYLVVGICGNSIVIVVYAIQMNEVSDERYFIPILATSDLIAVLYCASYGILKNVKYVTFSSRILCQTMQYFIGLTTYTSIVLLLIIAIQRYMKVWQAPKRPMTVFVKRGLVFLVFLISFLVALPIPFIYGTLPYKNEIHGINGTRCGKLKNSNMIAGVAYECIIGITTVVIVTALIVLYSKIGCTVHRKLIIRFLTMKTMKKKYQINTPTGRNTDNSEDYANNIKTDANLRLIGRDTDVDMTEEQRTSYLGVQSHTNAEEQRPTDLEERPADPKEQRLTTLEERQTDSKEQNPTDPEEQRPNGLEEERKTDPKEHRPTDPDEQRPTDPVEQIHTEPEEQRPTDNANTKTFPSPCSKKRKKAHRRIANKLTLMFFIITLLFMVSFLPKVILLNIEGIYQDFWENVSDVQRLLFTFFYQMYIINNIVNPFIYAFMDSQFRDDTKAMFKRLCPCP